MIELQWELDEDLLEVVLNEFTLRLREITLVNASPSFSYLSHSLTSPVIKLLRYLITAFISLF